VSAHEWGLVVRVVVGMTVAYAIGFEREVRGAPAGDRTFALIGAGAAVATAVTITSAPQAISGVMTGVGFVGAGVILRGERGVIVGITTAATIFTVAGIGVVAGAGHLLLAVVAGLMALLVLETRHLPFLRMLDARRYARFFPDDNEPPEHDEH
jgi:putative Mg2+ transporter-C (MgtC) family protein